MGPRVLVARFEGSVSVQLAGHVLQRFGEYARVLSDSYHFVDASGVERWQSSALGRLLDALLSQRERSIWIVARVSPKAAPVLGMLDPTRIHVITSEQAFEARLRLAAGSDFPAQGGVDAALARGATPLARSQAFIYAFDLSDFERGWLTAQRSERLAARPSGAWVCVARDDERASRLARQAAMGEWRLPTTRQPLAFSVRYVDAPAGG